MGCSNILKKNISVSKLSAAGRYLKRDVNSKYSVKQIINFFIYFLLILKTRLQQQVALLMGQRTKFYTIIVIIENYTEQKIKKSLMENFIFLCRAGEVNEIYLCVFKRHCKGYNINFVSNRRCKTY